VTIGTARARLVRSFGKPDLSVRTMQLEFLIETYVYEQQDRAIAGADAGPSVVSTRTGQVQRVRVLSYCWWLLTVLKEAWHGQ